MEDKIDNEKKIKVSDDIDGASPEEWADAAKSEVRDYLLPVFARQKAPTRFISGKIYPVSWKTLKGHCNGSGWVGTYRNKAYDVRDLDTHEARGYGFGVLLGEIIAIDCDIEDKGTSDNILQCLLDAVGKESIPRRVREGSSRWACLVAIDDAATPLPSDKGEVVGKGEVEFKGNGSLLVCAGVHKSGVHYRWIDGPCCGVVHLSIEQWYNFIKLCKDRVGLVEKKAARDSKNSLLRYKEGGCLANLDADFDATSDSLAKWLIDTGRISRQTGNKLDFVQCPWSAEHSLNSDGTAATSYFVGIDGDPSGFHCFHAHCSDRTAKDLREWAEAEGWENPVKVRAMEKERAYQRFWNKEAKVVSPVADGEDETIPTTTEENPEGISPVIEDFRNLYERTRIDTNKETGEIKEYKEFVYNTDSLETYLREPELCGIEIRYDNFHGDIYVRKTGEKWVRWDEFVTIGELERNIGRFFRINTLRKTAEITRRFLVVAHDLQGDSGLEAINSLPAWDGVSRLDTWLIDYAGVRDSEGVRELSAYTIRALTARLSCINDAGIKADIIPTFYGEQGKKKSLLVKNLSLLGPKGFTDEVRFDSDPTDTLRLTLGKCIVEIAELGGLMGKRKTRDDIKAWITKSVDRMTQKYEKNAKDYPRRWLPIITTNEKEILKDPSGSRRFAPIHIAEVGEVDLDGLLAVLPQLYAEAKFRNDQHNGEILDAQIALEKHLKSLQAEYRYVDPWEKAVLAYVETLEPGEVVTCDEVATNCPRLNMELARVDGLTKSRVSDILRGAGYPQNHHGFKIIKPTTEGQDKGRVEEPEQEQDSGFDSGPCYFLG